MVILKIIIVIMFCIGLLGVLVAICTGKLKTEEEIINDIEEESKYWENYERNKSQKKNTNLIKRIFNFITGGWKNE